MLFVKCTELAAVSIVIGLCDVSSYREWAWRYARDTPPAPSSLQWEQWAHPFWTPVTVNGEGATQEICLRVPVWLTLGRGCSECNILESCVGSEIVFLGEHFHCPAGVGILGSCAVQGLLAPYKPETIQA